MRECARVLVAGGRVAVLAIHTPSDLGPSEREEAAELGPSLVAGPPVADLFEGPGYTDVVVEDRTAAFAETCRAILRVRERMEAELRDAEGDEVFEDELRKKRGLLEGIRRGLLVRSVMSATAS